MPFNLRSRSIGFERVGEHAHPLKFMPTHKLNERLKLFFRFARETGNECCSQHQVRQHLSHQINLMVHLFLIDASRHSLEHHIVSMLQWHIDVRHNLVASRNRLEQFLIDVHRIEVHQTNPVETFNFVQLFQELRESRFAVKIHPVVGRILSNDNQFANAFGSQLLSFRNHVFHWLGGMLAAHLWNRAKRTKAIATF